MNEGCLQSAARIRAAIVAHSCSPDDFRAAFLDVPFLDRDAWVDAVFGLDELLPDGAELPKGCVPYLPSAVEALHCLADKVPMQSGDVWVDVGSGVGRAAVFMHLLKGVPVLGIEVQSAHLHAAKALVERLGLSDVSFVLGDVLEVEPEFARGTVFFLYCPFSGERLLRTLAMLEKVAQRRMIWVCTLDLPLPECGWIEPVLDERTDLRIYRSCLPRTNH